MRAVSIRILIVDDHHIVRQGLRALLESKPGMDVVAEAADGREAVRLANEHRPDVVIMDISMPELNGIDAARRILDEAPETKIVALSIHTDGRLVVDIFDAGASAYLVKDCAFEELAGAVRRAMQNKTYISPSAAGGLLDDRLQRPGGGRLQIPGALSLREREVLQLIAEGKSTKDAAAALGIGVKTVETHRARIMEKLNLRSVAELTKYAIRAGLTSVEK